jgi:WD40 repeat protein
VLTASDDKTARLWDATTGQPKGEPLRHQATVRSVAFSPDGRTVLTASWDHTARLWDVVPPAADDDERLRLSVEVRTGYYLNEFGNRSQLTLTQWLERRVKLERFCDVRSWDDLTEEEKQELRKPPKQH